MKRTTISLPDDLAAALEREAARRHLPVSRIAREAIETRLGWGEDEQNTPLIGLFDSGGVHGALSEYISSDEFTDEYASRIEADAFGRDP